MSQYTSLYVVPVDSPDWTPQAEMIKTATALLGVERVSSVSGYSVPDYWEDEDEDEDLYENVLFRQNDLDTDLATALALIKEQRPVYAHLMFQDPDYDTGIWRSLQDIPESVSEGTALDTVSVNLGPFSVPSYDWTTVVGRYHFSINLSGPNMPYEPEAFIQAVRETPEMKALLQHLESYSGKRWGLLLKCS